jgi:predicted HNH restriction endonuclease
MTAAAVSAIIRPMAEQRRFSADELVIMLAFVLGDEPGGAKTVPQLSDLLRSSLAANKRYVDDDAFRSVVGLRTSLGYMREIHEAEGDWPPPNDAGERRNWRPHFKLVWQRFGRDADARAVRVRAILEAPEASEEVEEPDFDGGFVEGRSYYALHRRRERSQAAVRRKKQTPAVCEVCALDFECYYGPHGADFIECHHVNQLADSDVTLTRLEDLALVCANCHRMLHHGSAPPTVHELREMVRTAEAARSAS